MPYSLRVASTWNVYKQVAPKLRAAIESSNKEAERARNLTSDHRMLDEVGWKYVIGAVDSCFQTIFEEQHDSRVRWQHGEGALRPADVFLVAFESAGSFSTPQGPDLVERAAEPLAPFSERLAPVLRDDVLLKITEELNNREVSPTQFHREIGGASSQKIWRGFRGLERYGWATRVGEKTGGQRRGGSEHFYKATKPCYREYDACANPPTSLSNSECWQTFERFCADAVGSMKAGLFDARTDRYVTWSNVVLDERGWEHVAAALRTLHSFILLEEQNSRQRIKVSGERPKMMTIGLAAMESAHDEPKAP